MAQARDNLGRFAPTTSKMTPSVKKAWLEDLRSGKYRRGENYLKQRENGRMKHCCLGVLCETYARLVPDAAIETDWRKNDDGELQFGDYTDTGMPPRAVLNWAGLTSEQAGELAEMNDEGKKFREIAKYIEEKL